MTNEENFAPLLSELRMMAKYDRNPDARPPSLAKASLPSYYYEEMPKPIRVTKISRSRHPMSIRYEGGDNASFSKVLRDMSDLNKSMLADTSEAKRQNTRRTFGASLERFSANLTKALRSGEISPDVACRLETERNNLAQLAAERGLI